MPKILVVDDEPTVRSLIRDTLELEDYEVAEAGDGLAALAAVEDDRPDCVILDIMMPGMSGLEVLATLRERETTTDLPVVLLTAATDDSTTWSGWAAGANVFLPKPFDPGQLLDWIERVLEGTEEAGQLE